MIDFEYVLDASAVLCLLNDEPGADQVKAVLSRSRLSAVNFIEIVSKLVDNGLDDEEIRSDLTALNIRIVDLDRQQAEQAGLMRAATRSRGLSLGDRACLALAARTNSIALTGDRAWVGLALEARVELFR
ncbi:MAG: type II toxin-antitoxin system VapC family toxin [Caulobacteraceae bacterium]